ncbi:Chromo domain-containing protein 2 [Colletotrichum chlorophyti]|uniref:Chromo domain-containing protein 2 n=1 Tax=Colletotrichum chlorophyti TaxID=708187 RepID=A0A1Q8RLK0_9PEZI|nr:Chromo domain-containing protein 2 [Colletotrichum chlorophyti]
MPRKDSNKESKDKKLTGKKAISDDEQSDIDGDIAVPNTESRAKSWSAGLRDDVGEAANDQDIPRVEGDLNGNSERPARSSRSAKSTSAEPVKPIDEDKVQEDSEDEDLDADEYVVEKILDHQVADDGTVNFRVKWEGYEKKADQTWEPEDSLKEGASEILEEYLEKLGGREKLFEEKNKAKTTKKRGRPTASSTPPAGGKRSKRNGADHALSASATAAKNKAWTLPSGSWEDDVESIDACEDEDSGSLIIYLNWKNGHKTKHPTEVVYKRCPQKMLQFYEKHIRIYKNEVAAAAPDEATA